MITTHKSNLIARCQQRGYTLAEVMPCVLSKDGDEWTIDVDHPAYPRTAREMDRKRSEAPTFGPGTELKKLLAKVGIKSSPTCSCNARAKTMDEKGCDWCSENLATIVGWLKEEHTRQKIVIPFSETAVSLLVRYAIRRARAISK